ncbi:twin-arginine translocase subunit TatC [Pelagibacterium xiamenense]|uniref:twin-arginine translocase subunit TatC n=1 Tax=Pelagibacterium xiamenense TaxID=2901140 RepID=UPI001E30C7B2|nr:twin-arginine translocase subunit TatC [Pelagibacterium xiamenense]MCD7061054.1 twin-arginine translocase subunit TatC [Pelagibacterium xiamenense]
MAATESEQKAIGSDTSTREDELKGSEAPLIEHLAELRTRLIYSVIALAVLFVGCFFVADYIYNFLLGPFISAAGSPEDVRLIYTAPQEFFFTKLSVALFAAIFLAFPVIASQIYLFVAPGLYKNERLAFLPYLIATPVCFVAGAALVYYGVMPLALRFFLGMQQTDTGGVTIEMVTRVSEYLSLTMTLLLAFGVCFQLPVILTLLAQVGLIGVEDLKRWRKYAVVVVITLAAFLTPPDPISQIGLAIPLLLLYELSIIAVRFIEKRRLAKEGD